VFIVHRPDIDEPVECKEHCGGNQKQKSAPFFYGHHEFIPVPLKYKDNQKKDKRPDGPMHNDFKGGNVAQNLPVDGAQTPDQKRCRCIRYPGQGFLF
jgi:hypothetical protein